MCPTGICGDTKVHPFPYQFHELPGGYSEGTHALCMTGGNSLISEQFLIDHCFPAVRAETEAVENVTENRKETVKEETKKGE